MTDTYTIIEGVSADTVLRVDAACREAGLGNWSMAVAECRAHGALHRVDFATRRPVDFVKEFAALVRAAGLKLGADNSLDLFLGTPEALESLAVTSSSQLCTHAVRTLADLGHVGEHAHSDIALSAAPRSAGITHIRRERPLRLANTSALLLDDDAVSRKVLSASLEREGCAIRAVGEAEAAFGLLKTATPDVIILDILLGGTMNGFDVCRAMRANPGFATIPVIFVTGHPEEHFALEAESVAGSVYFEKPVKPVALRDTVLALTRSAGRKKEHVPRRIADSKAGVAR